MFCATFQRHFMLGPPLLDLMGFGPGDIVNYEIVETSFNPSQGFDGVRTVTRDAARVDPVWFQSLSGI